MIRYLLSVRPPGGELGPGGLSGWEREVRAAGAWVFGGGPYDAGAATVVRAEDGDAVLTDGPLVPGDDQLGGFAVIRAADLDVAVGWARLLSQATGLPVEIRPLREPP